MSKLVSALSITCSSFDHASVASNVAFVSSLCVRASEVLRFRIVALPGLFICILVYFKLLSAAVVIRVLRVISSHESKKELSVIGRVCSIK